MEDWIDRLIKQKVDEMEIQSIENSIERFRRIPPLEQDSFIASAWSNGRTNNETGAGYGLRIKIGDWDRIFAETERDKPITLKLVGNRKSCEVTVRIDNGCFCKNCPEFRDQGIGLWFIENEFINRKSGSRPGPYRKPPKFQIVPIAKHRFEVNPVP